MTTQQMPTELQEREDTQEKPPAREGLGWLSMVLLMVLFPLLFFVCVFIPIWLGVTTP